MGNTGALLNYTYVKSEINYLDSTGAVVATGDLTGLSRNSYNATLYYEDARWSARVSAAYRDNYLTPHAGRRDGHGHADGTNSTLNVDASLQYTRQPELQAVARGREPDRRVSVPVQRLRGRPVVVLPPHGSRVHSRRALHVLATSA
jgi:iron complex outermembrane receptor protein